MSRPVLILRPQTGADATAARARDMGLVVRLYPLFAVEPLDWAPPNPAAFDALMFTSANALRHGGQALSIYRALPTFAVGEATAKAARNAGFENAIVAGPDAQATAQAIARSGHSTILHLCGADFNEPDAQGLSIAHIPVYRSVETGDAGGLVDALAEQPVALIHSPRAGRRCASLTPPHLRANIGIVAISPAALKACDVGWAEARCAQRPDDPAMLAIALEICQKAGSPPHETVSGTRDEQRISRD